MHVLSDFSVLDKLLGQMYAAASNHPDGLRPSAGSHVSDSVCVERIVAWAFRIGVIWNRFQAFLRKCP